MSQTHLRGVVLAIAVVASLQVGRSAWADTIAMAKLLPDATLVTIEDVVISNTIDLVNSVNSANLHVQDATGGVTIFASTDEIAGIFAGLNAGDQVDITGVTDSFNGLFELTPPLAVTLVADDVGVPAPMGTTTFDYQNLSATAELLESQLVRLPNVEFTGIAPGQTFASGVNYTVTDGINNAVARISNSAQSLVGDLIPTAPVNLTGIFSQFDFSNPAPGVPGSGYQLLLLDDSSVMVIPEPSCLALFALALAGLAGSAIRRRA